MFSSLFGSQNLLQILHKKKRSGSYKVNLREKDESKYEASGGNLFDHLEWSLGFLDLTEEKLDGQILGRRFEKRRGSYFASEDCFANNKTADQIDKEQRDLDISRNGSRLLGPVNSFAKPLASKGDLSQLTGQHEHNNRAHFGPQFPLNVQRNLLTQNKFQKTTKQSNGADLTIGNGQPNGKNQQDDVTLCSLGVGTTFGASVKPGKLHSVSVVTNEECTLLRVRRADFQEILNEKSHLIGDLEASPFFASSLSARINSFGASSSNQVEEPIVGLATRTRRMSSVAALGQHQHSGSAAGRRRLSLAPGQQQAAANSRPTGSLVRRQSVAATSSNATCERQPLMKAQRLPRQELGRVSTSQSGAAAAADGHSTRNNSRQEERQRQTKSAPFEMEQHSEAEDEEERLQRQRQQQAAGAEIEVGEDLNNLDSLEADELASQLMRAGWVLRTLMLAEKPPLVQNRLIYPAQLAAERQRQQLQQQLQQQQAATNRKQRKHLVGANSSSQLLSSGHQQQQSHHHHQPQQQHHSHHQEASGQFSIGTKTQAAGRKVANYVASSFMRSSSSNVAAASAAGSNNSFNQATANTDNRNKSSSSFDQTLVQQHQQGELHGRLSSMGGQREAANLELQLMVQQHGHQPVRFERSMVGREMVDWLLGLAHQSNGQTNHSTGQFVGTRLQAISVWQVLLEQGVLVHVPLSSGAKKQRAGGGSSEHGLDGGAPSSLGASQRGQNWAQFCDDSCAFYRFWFDRLAEDSDGQEDDSPSPSPPQPQPQPLPPHPPRQEAPPIRMPSDSELLLARESLWWALKVLGKLTPDACFRLILSKWPHERSCDEIDMVFEELQHLKALSHLTNTVKKQLSACVQIEYHAKQNTVIFNQGDAGHSWYIILRGSVNVVIVGKGVVCTLHDGDDFGKLALVNDAPRAATIVTNEPNCYFLRVDKHNFNTILRDVEANTVRLKEHGKEVLILQKIATREPPTTPLPPLSTSALNDLSQQSAAGPESGGPSQEVAQQSHSSLSNSSSLLAESSLVGSQHASSGPTSGAVMAAQSATMTIPATTAGPAPPSSQQLSQPQAGVLKYMVMAGAPEKMLEHLLETRLDGHSPTGLLQLSKSALFQHETVANFCQFNGDNFLEDFILTHKIFIPTSNLCNELLKQYQYQANKQNPTTSTTTSTTSATMQQNGKSNENSGADGLARGVSSTADGSGKQTQLDDEYLVAKKRRVIKFVRFWMLITREHFFQQQQIQTFVTTLLQRVKQDAQRFSSLQPELMAVSRIYELHLEENLDARHRGIQRWIEDVYGNILPIRRYSGAWQAQQLATSAPTMQQQQHLGGGAHSQSAVSEQFLSSLQQRRFELKLSTIRSNDELVFRVYCADHTFTTLKTRFDEQAGQIKQVAARNLKLEDKELILVHLKSNGERIIYNDLETNICTCLSVNGRLFVCPLDHIDAIAPLPEQDPFQQIYSSLGNTKLHQHRYGNESASLNEQQLVDSNNNNNNNGSQLNQSENQPLSNSNETNSRTNSWAEQQQTPISSHLLVQTPTNYSDIKLQMGLSVGKLEEFSSRDIAYCLTQLAWSLLKNMHEFELIYTVFGRHNFKQVTANLNVFLRHFNEIQYWVVTQICLSTSLSKRVQILRKFIKIAAHCKEMQNLNAFFAIIMGLSNMAVARLTQTWERLPSKLKRLFSQFESQIDPSRNHRRYRIFISKLEPPIIPFMPLFLKDMTFAHEGNKTHLENGLINFEKMQMIAQTLRTIRYCKSRALKLDSSVCKFKGSVRSIELFFRDLKIIDNQRTLTQMSHQLEHRKT